MTPTYDCSKFPEMPSDVSIEQCKNFICEMPKEIRIQNIYFGLGYSDKHEPFTQYAELYCERESLLALLKSMPYLGSFIGFLVFPAISDNKGRKFSHTLALAFGSLGCILMACATGEAAFIMMLIGFLIAGFALNPGTSIHFSYLKEITLGEFRENASSLI